MQRPFYHFSKSIRSIFFIGSLILGISSARSQNALATSWTGYADTTTTFSSFFNSAHTISFAFMPQFPNAAYQPIIAENGSGTFGIGIGDFREGGKGTKLYLAVGAKSQLYPVTLKAGQWYRVTVVCEPKLDGWEFRIFLNNFPLSPTPLSVSKKDPQLPTGSLRFCKRTSGRAVNGQDGQFYGLLDNVGIFNKALHGAEIIELAGIADIGNLSNSIKSSLIASYNFTDNNPTLKGAAQIVDISATKSSESDKVKMILPTAHREMTLPIRRGETWIVTQECDNPYKTGTHNGYASFCWDLILADKPDSGEYPSGTAGAPVHAAASGKVIIDYTPHPGYFAIKQANDEICSYLHNRKFLVSTTAGTPIMSGDVVAEAGHTGSAEVFESNHIHIGVRNALHGAITSTTSFPVAFSNYEVKQPNGTWKFVERGMPKLGEIVRIPPTTDLPYRVTAVFEPIQHDEIQVYGLKYADFQKKYNQLLQDGWRLTQVKTHVSDSQLLYTAIWKKASDLEAQVLGLKYADYRKRYDELWPQGWRLALLDVTVLNGTPLYTAVWRKSNVDEFPIYGWTYNDFEKKYDELGKQGWRLKLLAPYVQNNSAKYTAVWRKSSEPVMHLCGCKYEDFKKKYDELWPQGWRLALLANYTLNNQLYYNAVWCKGTSGEIQLYNWKYANYYDKYDHLWKDGWGLKILSIY